MGNAERMAVEFAQGGAVRSCRRHGAGNINDTFLVTAAGPGGEFRFILQRLNTNVFPSPAAVMRNTRLVLDHLYRRATEAALGESQWRIPSVLPNREGADLAVDAGGGCWRALSFVDGAQTYPSIRDAVHAREAGRALGVFHALTADLAPDGLSDTLPGFHETPTYLAALDRALAGRGGSAAAADSAMARECRAFIEARRFRCGVLEQARARGDLRVRTVHGDPKADNVLYDAAAGRAVGMIDFDTVKPGLVLYDFGDGARSCCNPLGEDPPDPASAIFDLGLFEAYACGYLSAAGGCLSAADRALLYDSVRLMAFELALRFFCDHVAGDRYFKIRYGGQNLRRARAQMSVCLAIEDQEAAIRRMTEGTHREGNEKIEDHGLTAAATCLPAWPPPPGGGSVRH